MNELPTVEQCEKRVYAVFKMILARSPELADDVAFNLALKWLAKKLRSEYK